MGVFGGGRGDSPATVFPTNTPIFTILNDYDILDGQRISATSHPVDWFGTIAKGKYFRSAVLNAFRS